MKHVSSINVIALVFWLASCQESSEEQASEEGWSTAFPGKADVYGEDSRKELYDPRVSEIIQKLSQAVSMVYNTTTLNSVDDDFIFFSQATMSDHYQRDHGVPLCEDEPFSRQIAPGFCTAFLITPTLMATAGHCVNGHTRCEQMGFIFEYAKDSPNEDPVSAPLRHNYRCEAIVGRLYNPFEEPEMISNGEYWQDWAVLKLDRPVTDREPVKFMEGEPLTLGAPLTVLGHPSGLPMKVTEGRVITDDKVRYFNTTLDIYQGNSGSPAFDAYTGDVHGIVIRGSGGDSFEIGQKLVPNSNGSFDIVNERCGRSKHCERVGDPGCIGNHVLRIDPLRPFINPDLQFVEKHSLIEDFDAATTFRHSFTFEGIEGKVEFATLNLNAGARDSEKLRVILHHNEQSIVMMNHPQKLSSGRWTATQFDFKGADPNGEWVIEVIDEGEGKLSVEWAQVMLGLFPAAQEAPEMP